MAERILMTNGNLKVTDNPIIPFIEGDGVGRDIWKNAQAIFDKAVEVAYGGQRRIEWQEFLAGKKAFDKTGEWLPQETLEAIRESLVAIKGPLETPVGGGIRSLNVALRQELDLYACVRPVRYFEGVASPLKEPEKTDITIFRENTEDIYAGIEWVAGTVDVERVIAFFQTEMNVDKESFASLMGLKEQLKVKQEEEARIAAEKEQKRKEAEAKAHEFENAMKELGVKKKIGREDKVFHAMPKPAPIPRQRYADEKAVLEDSLSDNISIDHLLDSDERLSYRAPSMAPDVPKKLHQGAWSVKGTLDLHGYTSEEARLLLVEFLNEERKAGHRAVRIIHGQGFGSAGRKPVLKEKVPVWQIGRASCRERV